MSIWLIRTVVVALVLVAAARVARAATPASKEVPAASQPAGEKPHASEGEPQSLDDILEAIRTKHKIPAIAGAIVEGDATVAIGAAGTRRAAGTEPVTIDDKFHLGSCTKAMTATLIAMLVEDGTLAWNTTISDIFAEVEMDAGWKTVTIEQLLTNSGGAPAGLDRDGLWGKLWSHGGTPTQQRLALVEGVLKHPPEAAPGEKFIYSNAGFAIAGAMAEKKTGKAWEDLMRERLFNPLGMTSAGFGAPGAPETVDQPRGHRTNGTPVEPGKSADNPAAIGPAGIVHCTIGDWAKFIAMHIRGERDPGDGTKPLLKPESFKKLHAAGAAQGSDYAMGWIVTQRSWAGNPGRVLTHAGSNTMWFTVVWIAPEGDFAVLACSNQAGRQGERACDQAASELIAWRTARNR